MTNQHRDEMLARIDERTRALHERLDSLPCSQCLISFSVLNFLCSRRGAALIVALFGLGYAAEAFTKWLPR